MTKIVIIFFCCLFISGCATVANPNEGQLRIMFTKRHLDGAKRFMEIHLYKSCKQIERKIFADPNTKLEFTTFVDPFDGSVEDVVRANYVATCGDVKVGYEKIQFGKNSLGWITKNGKVSDISPFMYIIK